MLLLRSAAPGPTAKKEKTLMPPSDISNRPLMRRAALIAGLGLLGMIVLAPFANFYVLDRVIANGDAVATLANVRATGDLLRWGIGAFLIVALLDVVVAWALYDFLAPAGRSGARLAAWLRVAYAATYVAAFAPLLDVLRWASGAPELAALDPVVVQAQVTLGFQSFNDAWTLGLALFGLHLLAVGILAWRSGDVPRWLGALVLIAGLGYLVDTFAKILFPALDLGFLTITFFGEAVFAFWLVWRGFRP